MFLFLSVPTEVLLQQIPTKANNIPLSADQLNGNSQARFLYRVSDLFNFSFGFVMDFRKEKQKIKEDGHFC